MAKIIVNGTAVTVLKINEKDYISLTDMIKAKEGHFFLSSWLRNRNTVEFLGVWESVFNPDFNYAEINQLICLANLENINSVLIEDGFPQNERLEKLNQIAINQMTILSGGIRTLIF